MLRWFLLLFCLLPFTPAAWAEETMAPDALVRNVTEEVLNILRNDRDIQRGDARKVNELVDTKVLPHFDFTRMTQLALARDWRAATTAQQRALTEEFRQLLVRTYSRALTEYRNQSIVVRSLRIAPSDSEVRVRTEVRQSGGKPVQIDYSLARTDQGWKVFDIEVGGISLVTNYRSSFAQEVREKGIEGLLRTLREKNRALENESAEKK